MIDHRKLGGVPNQDEETSAARIGLFEKRDNPPEVDYEFFEPAPDNDWIIYWFIY